MNQTSRENLKRKFLGIELYKWFLDAILFIVMERHIIFCPYTKVEESFNLQAVHDLLYHGSNITQFDHLEFPGVVPRTFLGPLVVAGLSYPFLFVVQFLELNKFVMQYVVRTVLGCLVLLAFHKFKTSIEKQFGTSVCIWLQFITATQFHFMFYMSRPLPNTFALALALLSFHYWLSQNQKMFILTSAAVVIVFRAELCILLGLIALQELVMGRLSILQILCWGIPSGMWMFGLTVLVDSYFWMRPVWPEGEVLWFNIFLNKSSEWGVLPWGWYFYSALPRALSASIIFIPLSLVLDQRIRILLYPALGFIFLYSYLPHKELRFIIYTIPLFNVAAARTCSYLFNNRFKSWTSYYGYLISTLHILANMALTVLVLNVSYYNYPGGYAMSKLHEIEAGAKDLNIHIDVFTAQTGVSRFTEENSDWRYNKSESLSLDSLEIMHFTHLLVEWTDEIKNPQSLFLHTHSVINVTNGYSTFKIKMEYPPIQVFLQPKIMIFKRKISYPSVILNNTRTNSLKI